MTNRRGFLRIAGTALGALLFPFHLLPKAESIGVKTYGVRIVGIPTHPWEVLTRIKAKIRKVGTVTFANSGEATAIMDWWFDSTGCTEVIPWDNSQDGGILVGGWTPSELKSIEIETYRRQ